MIDEMVTNQGAIDDMVDDVTILFRTYQITTRQRCLFKYKGHKIGNTRIITIQKL